MTTPAYNRLNSSGSTSSGSNSPSATNNPKIATGFDYEKRIKQIKKLAAEKSLTKKSWNEKKNFFVYFSVLCMFECLIWV